MIFKMVAFSAIVLSVFTPLCNPQSNNTYIPQCFDTVISLSGLAAPSITIDSLSTPSAIVKPTFVTPPVPATTNTTSTWQAQSYNICPAHCISMSKTPSDVALPIDSVLDDLLPNHCFEVSATFSGVYAVESAPRPSTLERNFPFPSLSTPGLHVAHPQRVENEQSQPEYPAFKSYFNVDRGSAKRKGPFQYLGFDAQHLHVTWPLLAISGVVLAVWLTRVALTQTNGKRLPLFKNLIDNLLYKDQEEAALREQASSENAKLRISNNQLQEELTSRDQKIRTLQAELQKATLALKHSVPQETFRLSEYLLQAEKARVRCVSYVKSEKDETRRKLKSTEARLSQTTKERDEERVRQIAIRNALAGLREDHAKLSDDKVQLLKQTDTLSEHIASLHRTNAILSQNIEGLKNKKQKNDDLRGHNSNLRRSINKLQLENKTLARDCAKGRILLAAARRGRDNATRKVNFLQEKIEIAQKTPVHILNEQKLTFKDYNDATVQCQSYADQDLSSAETTCTTYLDDTRNSSIDGNTSPESPPVPPRGGEDLGYDLESTTNQGGHYVPETYDCDREPEPNLEIVPSSSNAEQSINPPASGSDFSFKSKILPKLLQLLNSSDDVDGPTASQLVRMYKQASAPKKDRRSVTRKIKKCRIRFQHKSILRSKLLPYQSLPQCVERIFPDQVRGAKYKPSRTRFQSAEHANLFKLSVISSFNRRGQYLRPIKLVQGRHVAIHPSATGEMQITPPPNQASSSVLNNTMHGVPNKLIPMAEGPAITYVGSLLATPESMQSSNGSYSQGTLHQQYPSQIRVAENTEFQAGVEHGGYATGGIPTAPPPTLIPPQVVQESYSNAAKNSLSVLPLPLSMVPTQASFEGEECASHAPTPPTPAQFQRPCRSFGMPMDAATNGSLPGIMDISSTPEPSVDQAFNGSAQTASGILHPHCLGVDRDGDSGMASNRPYEPYAELQQALCLVPNQPSNGTTINPQALMAPPASASQWTHSAPSGLGWDINLNASINFVPATNNAMGPPRIPMQTGETVHQVSPLNATGHIFSQGNGIEAPHSPSPLEILSSTASQSVSRPTNEISAYGAMGISASYTAAGTYSEATMSGSQEGAMTQGVEADLLAGMVGNAAPNDYLLATTSYAPETTATDGPVQTMDSQAIETTVPPNTAPGSATWAANTAFTNNWTTPNATTSMPVHNDWSETPSGLPPVVNPAPESTVVQSSTPAQAQAAFNFAMPLGSFPSPALADPASNPSAGVAGPSHFSQPQPQFTFTFGSPHNSATQVVDSLMIASAPVPVPAASFQPAPAAPAVPAPEPAVPRQSEQAIVAATDPSLLDESSSSASGMTSSQPSSSQSSAWSSDANLLKSLFKRGAMVNGYLDSTPPPTNLPVEPSKSHHPLPQGIPNLPRPKIKGPSRLSQSIGPDGQNNQPEEDEGQMGQWAGNAAAWDRVGGDMDSQPSVPVVGPSTSRDGGSLPGRPTTSPLPVSRPTTGGLRLPPKSCSRLLDSEELDWEGKDFLPDNVDDPQLPPPSEDQPRNDVDPQADFQARVNAILAISNGLEPTKNWTDDVDPLQLEFKRDNLPTFEELSSGGPNDGMDTTLQTSGSAKQTDTSQPNRISGSGPNSRRLGSGSGRGTGSKTGNRRPTAGRR